MGIGWEDMEHISTPGAARLPEDLSEGVKGETNQGVRGRNWWLGLDGNIEQKLEDVREHKMQRKLGEDRKWTVRQETDQKRNAWELQEYFKQDMINIELLRA